MTTAENIAMGRRIAAIEAAIGDQAGIFVRSTFVICERAREPEYRTVEEVLEAAAKPPQVVEVDRLPDLELLIDPVDQTRALRHEVDEASFDELKKREGVRLVDVEIRCHRGQLEPIRSKAPTTAAFGGNRSGKTEILIARLFRRWMLRGGRGHVGWWVGPDTTKLIEEGVWRIAGPQGLGGGRWPDELFVGLTPCPRTKKNPALMMVDGSEIRFKHANHKGEEAGKNLKSANIFDAVVDEIGAIKSHDNWHQVVIRVSETGGTVAGSTTRVRNHWSHEKITERAKQVGSSIIDVHHFDLFDNPWLTYARIWQLFLNDGTLTPQQLETYVLPAADKRAACLDLITNPKSLREHFGIETATSPFMWSHWRDEYIYTSSQRRHAELHINREGQPLKLINITAEVLAKKWPRERRRFEAWAGMDFNVRGHAVVFELFGEGDTVAEAVANEESWTVMIVDEVQVDGTTLALAEQLREQAGIIPVWYDPHGAKGHAARGSGTSSDAQILRGVGFPCAPANGVDIKSGKPLQLSQIDSRNVMHALMAEGRHLVHQRCVGTLDAMHKDMRAPDGRGEKRSSPDSPSDLRTGYSDSDRYGLWPIFRGIFASKTR